MKRYWLCLLLTLPLWADVAIDRKTDQIDVTVDGKPFTSFFFGPDTMKPFLAPLRAADGTIVTRRWPMESNIEGESHDHPHHTGLWFTHDDVNGVKFWENPKPGPDIGRVVLDRIDKTRGGNRTGVIEADFRWEGPDNKVILREHRKMTFYSDPENRIIDIDITLRPNREPVKFGDTKEGTFGIRLADKMTEKQKGGMMTNAAGQTGMKAVWGKPSPWVDYAGTLDGKPVGVAIFDHRENPKHPTYWHARDYGLFAANPFGEKDFFRDKTRDGSLTIQPGKSLRFRYRVIIHPGLTANTPLAEMYSKYR